MVEEIIDWEPLWNALGSVSGAVFIILSGFLLVRLMEPFLSEKRYKNAVLFSYIFVMLILKYIPYEMSYLFAHMMGMVTAFLVMCLVDKKNREQKFFLAVTFYLLDLVARSIILEPWDLLYDVLILRPVMMEHPYLQFYFFCFMEWLNPTLYAVVMALLIKAVHRIYTYKQENIEKRELALILAPFLSLIMGYGLFRYSATAYEMDTQEYIWDYHLGWGWMQTLYMTLSFAAMLTVIFSYQRIKENQRKEKEEAVLFRQVEDMERHVAEVEKMQLHIRSLKHDMRNHVMVLERLCGQNEDAREYVAKLKEQVDETVGGAGLQTGNPVADIILDEKRKEAERRGILFTCDFFYPERNDINIYDISVILNNAIDNAIEGASECENPCIKILSYRKNNAYMIEIRNSMTGSRAVDEESGLPRTTKEGEGHGFGLSNIRKVAQKYYGDIAIEQKDGEFVLAVMLMLMID